MRKWVLRSLSLTLIVALFLMGTGVALAQGSGDATPAGAADIVIDVQESGNWGLRFGASGLALSSENVASLANRYNMALPPIAVDPGIVSLAEASGIQHLALRKAGNETTVYINGIPATAVDISDDVLKVISDEFVPELEGLVSWLAGSNLNVVVNFPADAAAEKYVLDLERGVALAVDDGAKANSIGLGATISPEGRIVSIGGIPAADLGLNQAIDMSWMQAYGLDKLGLEQIGLALDANGLTMSNNGTEWVSVMWDAQYVADNADSLARMVGYTVDPAVVDTALAWVKESEVNIQANLSEESGEAAPVVSIGRPLALAVHDRAIYVEGFGTGYALDDSLVGYLDQLGSTAITWDGASRQVRLAVGDKAYPAIELGEGFVSGVASKFAGDILPWGTVEQVLGDAQFTAQLDYEGTGPADVDLLATRAQYVDATTPMVVDITLGRADGKIAIGGEALPLAAFGLDTKPIVDSLAAILGPISTANLSLGPSGVAVGLDSQQVRLVWDDTTRANLLDAALGALSQQPGMAALNQTGLVRWAVDSAIYTISNNAVDVQLGFSDEPLKSGSIEQFLALLVPAQ